MAVWLKDRNGGSGREAEWVMLLIKFTKKNVFQIVESVKKTITYYIVESIYQF